MNGIRIIFQVLDSDEAVSIQSSRVIPLDQLPDCAALEEVVGKYARRFWDTVAMVRAESGSENPAG